MIASEKLPVRPKYLIRAVVGDGTEAKHVLYHEWCLHPVVVLFPMSTRVFMCTVGPVPPQATTGGATRCKDLIHLVLLFVLFVLRSNRNSGDNRGGVRGP